MLYKILADILTVIHFGYILFMLYGFALTIRGFFRKEFFERWIFRTLHMFGIIFVAILAVMNKYCPLTIWEANLAAKYNPGAEYTGGFIVRHIENLLYPDVNPLVVIIPTYFIALFTLLVFIIKPPEKIKLLFKRK